MDGNWGITSNVPVTWQVALTENWASPEALANGPLTNDTVTGGARTVRPARASARNTAPNASTAAKPPSTSCAPAAASPSMTRGPCLLPSPRP